MLKASDYNVRYVPVTNEYVNTPGKRGLTHFDRARVPFKEIKFPQNYHQDKMFNILERLSQKSVEAVLAVVNNNASRALP